MRTSTCVVYVGPRVSVLEILLLWPSPPPTAHCGTVHYGPTVRDCPLRIAAPKARAAAAASTLHRPITGAQIDSFVTVVTMQSRMAMEEVWGSYTRSDCIKWLNERALLHLLEVIG